MLNNYYFLREYSVFLVDKILFSKISTIFTQEKDKLVICFEMNNKILCIEFSRLKNNPYILLRENFKKTGKNYVNLFNELYKNKIKDIITIENERIVKIVLENNICIFISLIPSKLNVFITKDNNIINAYKNKSELISKNINEYLNIRKSIEEKKNVQTIKDLINKYYFSLGSMYIDDILFRLKLTEETRLKPGMTKRINSFVNNYINDFKNLDYYLYHYNDKYYLSLTKLETLKEYFFKEYNDINLISKDYLAFNDKKSSLQNFKKEKLVKLNLQLKQKLNLKNNLQTQINAASDAEKYKKYGNIILSNVQNIQAGDEELIFFDEENGVYSELKLNPNLSASENANLFFAKYKKYKSSENILKKKFNNAESEIEKLKSEIILTEQSENILESTKENKSGKENINRSKFRIFKIDEKNEVWVGKSSESNDLLTFKFSNPEDIWFHVRGYSGSHTVLKRSNKKENIDKNILETAASIAAYYSKARNAGTIPVAYCERKFVKKRKGFKTGTVIMEREKLVYVRPSLPEKKSEI